MKKLRFISLPAMMLLAWAMQAQYTLNLQLTNMDPYLGKSFTVRVTEQPSGKEVGRKSIEMLENNSASLLLYVFLMNRNYNVDFYVDVNENGSYDAPATDHAWRRTVMNVTTNRNIMFTPDDIYTDIGFPNDAFPFSQYNSTWGGRWRNLTFGSTDSIRAAFRLTCDSIIANFVTKGVFGNPAEVSFGFEDEIPQDTTEGPDTIQYSPGPPWTGSVTIIGSDIDASLSLAPLTLNFQGTLGAKQILCLYQVLNGPTQFANGYFYVRELQIMSSAPELTVQGVATGASCFGAKDGNIEVTPEGGSPPYAYEWSNGATAATISFLGPGTFDVTVTDNDGCTETASFTVTEPEQIQGTAEITPASCFGACDGGVFITVFGGLLPYSYAWNNGVSTPFLMNVCAGIYTMTVTDANGCTFVTEVGIISPLAIVIDVIEVIDTEMGQANGSITTIASGGVPPLQYSLDGAFYQSSNIFQGLSAGVYFVYIRDELGCIIQSDSITITELTGIRDLTAVVRWYPNPTGDYIRIESEVPLTLEIFEVRGSLLIKQQVRPSEHVALKELPSGLYILRLTDGIASGSYKLIRQ